VTISIRAAEGVHGIGLRPATPDLAETFAVVGRRLATLCEEQGLLGDGVRFLDIGCGCGRIGQCPVARKRAARILHRVRHSPRNDRMVPEVHHDMLFEVRFAIST